MDIPLHVTATDLDTMHRAVLLDPGDDVARLALADACEEAGELGRAEFVRAQIEAERLRRPGLRASMDDPGFRALAALNRAECRLLDQHWRTWAGCGDVFQEWHTHRFRVDVGRRPAVAFRRGLVESVALPLAAFMEHAEALFRAHPITAVTLTDREFAYAYWVSSGRAVCSGPGYENHGAWIPHLIFRHLKGATIRSARFRGYADLVLARAALSAACVAYGRREAGLPPLLPATGRAVDGPAVVR